MYYSERKVEISNVPSVSFILFAVALCFFCGLNGSKASADPNEVLYNTVVEGLRENIAKLTSATLVSHEESMGYGPWKGRTEKREQQLWWKEGKLAATNKWESITTDENGQIKKNSDARIMTWNGKDFRIKDIKKNISEKVDMALLNKPRYHWGDNYLNDIGWQGPGLISGVLSKPLATEPGKHYWSTEDGKDGSRLIKHEFRNSRTGQVGRRYYDVTKGCGLVRDENYASPTQLQARTTIQYTQVSGGSWFPVDVNVVSFNIQNGEIIHKRKIEIDLAKSAFNNPKAIPEDIFELQIGPNTEVSDFRWFGIRILYPPSVNPIIIESSVACAWLLLSVVIVVCVFGTMIWILKSRRTSVHH